MYDEEMDFDGEAQPLTLYLPSMPSTAQTLEPTWAKDS